ncbi:protein kinase [Achlya hypogyna]|uniref:Protein kinase n=1 Tax=Achlya hypogyna TaxID=1202772 RepID=A0A1V9YKB9_ACHHY|nr:protein kinase [Achlya hypogyna]
MTRALMNGDHETALLLHSWYSVGVREVDQSQLIVNESERLGHGAFGDVYRGTYCDRQVAVKKLRDQNSSQFDREIRLLTKCSSPYIVQLIASSPTQLVLELMDAGDLCNFLKDKRSGIWTKVDYSMLEVAWAIAHALVDLHGRRVIHRDLKSANVLLSTDKYIKVGDFGASNILQTTMTMHIVGTVAYVAPEVLRNNGRYGAAADIYSYGVILTELDTLQLPYTDSIKPMGVVDILHGVSAGTLRPTISDACAPWMRALITACLEESPQKRPTALEIVTMLAPHMKGDGRCISADTLGGSQPSCDAVEADVEVVSKIELDLMRRFCLGRSILCL